MVKSIFNDQTYINYEKAILICDKYKNISFDIFDTLIKRNVKEPNSLFLHLGEYAKKYNFNDFYENRIKVARKLFSENSFATLNDIYEKLNEIYNNNPKLEDIKEYEMELEISYCQPNHEIKRVYDYCKKNNKKIYAISDMYLPKNVIEKILNESGYEIQDIYISCECLAKKSDGSLFSLFLENKKISSKELLHIGDSFKADYLGAKKANIRSIHIKSKANKFNSIKFFHKINEKTKYETYLSIINNNIMQEDSYYYKFGLSILGPLVYNYCLWLKENCDKNIIKKIFFFARDGYILKKAFDILYPNIFETHYLYVSRRAIRVPYNSIYSTYEDVINFFPESKILTVKIFFENLGLDAEKYIKLIQDYGFNIDDNIYFHELKTNERLRKIFEKVYDDFVANSKIEYDNMKKYFDQEDFKGKVAIVDVGWHNSMQFYLENIFPKEYLEINGYYVGFQQNMKEVDKASAFIRDNTYDIYANSSLGFIGLIESVFLAREGSTKTYKKNNNQITPELFDYEYKKEDIEYKAFTEIQKGIIEFINIAKKMKDFEFYRLNGYDSYLPLKSYGTNPCLIDVEKFENFRYYSEEIVYFAKKHSVKEYIINPKLIISDLYRARWKIGYLKKILKIPFPYCWLYFKLRGIKK